MPTRQTHTSSDPFTDAPLRHPTIAPPNLRATAAAAPAPTNHSLRSNASTASSRSRQQQTNLFAPSLSRRPTSRRTTPSFEEEILADEVEDDAEELGAALQQQRRQVRYTRARLASPESKLARAQQKARLERERGEEVDFVLRKSDGSFLREVDGLEACLSAHLQAEEMVDEAELKAMDEAHASAVRHYFTTAPAAGTRANEKHERNFEEHFPAVSSRLRQQVLSKLEAEKWRYEPMMDVHRRRDHENRHIAGQIPRDLENLAAAKADATAVERRRLRMLNSSTRQKSSAGIPDWSEELQTNILNDKAETLPQSPRLLKLTRGIQRLTFETEGKK